MTFGWRMGVEPEGPCRLSEDGTGLKIMEGECTFPEMSETHHRLFSDSLLPNMVITSRGCICISYKTC